MKKMLKVENNMDYTENIILLSTCLKSANVDLYTSKNSFKIQDENRKLWIYLI